MRLNRTIGLNVLRKGTSDNLGELVDLLIDVSTGKVVYALVSPGTVSADVLLSRARLSESGGKLEADVSDEDLERFRVGSGEEVEPGGPLDLATMPPMVVGPFGNVIAPAMGAALFNALAGRDRRERPRLDEAHATWHWFEALHGLSVFDATEDLGVLDDIVANPETLTCEALELRDSGGQLYNFPFDSIRMVSRGETSIVLELSKTPPYSVERIQDELRGD